MQYSVDFSSSNVKIMTDSHSPFRRICQGHPGNIFFKFFRAVPM